MMKLKAWMETYLHRSRRGKNKDKKRSKVPTTPMVNNDVGSAKLDRNRTQPSEDRLNGNVLYNDNDFDRRSMVTDGNDDIKTVAYWTTAYDDVRRTPLLGLRSAAYSRSISCNTKQVNEPGGDSLSMHSALYGSSLTSILTPQSCMSPMNRSKIKTNPWYSSLQSQQSVTPSDYIDEYSTPKKSVRSHSTISDGSVPMDESLSLSSSYAADASNASTLDSAYRAPIHATKKFSEGNKSANNKNIVDSEKESLSRSASSECSTSYTEDSSSSNISTLDSTYRMAGTEQYRTKNTGFGSTGRNRDSGYLSQDSKYRSLKKSSAQSQEAVDTDDSGTLMEKDWSSPEVEKCEIVPKNKTISSVEVDEAYSEVSSLPSESPEDETFPEFQNPDRTIENKRTISEICGNLEEKVRRLRFERLLVEEKIKEAREEERIRCEERVKFQKEMIVHRRQILLRTLQQIRFKLEDQGHRLQDAYNATLGMQLKVRTDQLSRHASDDASSSIS